MDADRRIAFFMNDFSSIWAVPPNTDLTNLVSHQEALFNGWITIPGAGPNNLANAPQMLSTVNQPNGMAMFIPGSQFHGQYRPPLTSMILLMNSEAWAQSSQNPKHKQCIAKASSDMSQIPVSIKESCTPYNFLSQATAEQSIQKLILKSSIRTID